MGQTRYFGMSFFDFGDSLDSSLNVEKEKSRFVLIDKQLYGLYNVFGNGVVSGWTVTDGGYTKTDGINVNISPGLGIINYMACQTDIPGNIQHLPSNTTFYIYVFSQGSTPRDRSVNFSMSIEEINSSSVIKLAQVVTGDNKILIINNNVRELISFEEIIQREINEHKHRGSPTKIDLQEEVKNQLPGARIESIDASKITSGVFDINRIPLIDHNQLENSGLLTHAALDSFVRGLSQSNKELLGEIASVNLLKTVIFLKYLYQDIDEYFVNELVLIPGISPDSFIDFNASTAHINLEEQCISGYPAKTGLFTSVYWRDQTSLYNAYLKNNVVISNGEISLERSVENVHQIEKFNVPRQGAPITTFDFEIISTDQEIGVVSDISDGNKIEGDSAGKFSAHIKNQARYVLDLRTNIDANIGEDWSINYDELVIWVKTINPVHEAVYMKLWTWDETALVGQKQKEIGPFTLIAANHVTANSDPTKNGFEEIVIKITGYNVTNVTHFIIYTDELSSSFSFYADNLYVRKRNLVAPSGTVRFRYSTEADVIFHSIWYEAEVVENTSIEVRVKTSTSTDLLSRSAYSLPINSGDVFALPGSAAEIEVTLTSTDQLSTPVFTYLELRMMVSGDFSGFEINSSSDWLQGSYENISLQPTGSIDTNLIISDAINVGGYYFGYSNSLSEMDDTGVGKIGFSGSYMPISPNQAFNWKNSPFRQFDFLSSVFRKFNKNFLIADTMNNRVLEVNSSGQLVRGFGSTYSVDNELYPLSVVYNPIKHVLVIVFTKAVTLVDKTKIVIYIGSTPLRLTTSEQLVTPLKEGGKILEISLSEDNWVILSNVSNSFTTDISISIEEGAFTEEISDLTSRFVKQGLYGMSCYVGNFSYIENINHPIFVNVLDNGNWLIANSLLQYDKDEDTFVTSDASTPSLVELDIEDEEFVYTTNDVVFSDFTLGGVCEYQENKFIVACLKEGEAITGGITGAELKEKSTILTDKVKFRAAAIDALNAYKGKLILIDKVNKKFQTFYTSPDGLYPTDVDMYDGGDLLISESSFVDSSGRIARLDSFGNITWAYANGSFNIINDARVLSNEHIMVSS